MKPALTIPVSGALQATLHWTQRVFFTGAVAMLGWWSYSQVDSWMFQREALRQFQLALTHHSAQAPVVSSRTTPGGLIGRIDIPRLGVSVMVIEGTTSKSLRRAAGHVIGTAFPGETGNVAISAHRDTFFRPVRNIRGSDIISLTTPAGEFRYRVVSTQIVDPASVEVLEAGEGESLTLVTCYPFYFIGNAPKRFIVRATRVVEPAPHTV